MAGIVGTHGRGCRHVWELNAVLLGLLVLATTAVLVRAGVGKQIWGWALAPPLVWYSFHNWDLLAILPATAGMALWRAATRQADVWL